MDQLIIYLQLVHRRALATLGLLFRKKNILSHESYDCFLIKVTLYRGSGEFDRIDKSFSRMSSVVPFCPVASQENFASYMKFV